MTGQECGFIDATRVKEQNSYSCWTLAINLALSRYMSSVMAQTHHVPRRQTGAQVLWASLSLKDTSSHLSFRSLGDLLEAGVVLWVQSRFLWVPLPCRQVMSPAEVAPKLPEAWRLCTRGMV